MGWAVSLRPSAASDVILNLWDITMKKKPPWGHIGWIKIMVLAKTKDQIISSTKIPGSHFSMGARQPHYTIYHFVKKVNIKLVNTENWHSKVGFFWKVFVSYTLGERQQQMKVRVRFGVFGPKTNIYTILGNSLMVFQAEILTMCQWTSH